MTRTPDVEWQRSGFALLAVLWVIIAAAALGLAVSIVAREAIATARNRIDLTRAAWLAEGCLENARAAIHIALNEQTPISRLPIGWAALDLIDLSPGGLKPSACDVSLRAAGTAIDVNSATSEQLASLFRVKGLAPAAAESVAAAMLDWRDADAITRPHGAESTWYRSNKRLPPRDGMLMDARELRRIRGLENMPALDSVLGVEPGRISLQHAPAAVLASLPGVGEEAVFRILESRRRGRSVNLAEIIETLSPRARELMLQRYVELLQTATTDPDAWILTSRARVGLPPVTSVIEVRLQRAGERAAIVRRKTWIE